jgi:hypothetical protein
MKEEEGLGWAPMEAHMMQPEEQVDLLGVPLARMAREQAGELMVVAVVVVLAVVSLLEIPVEVE